MEKYSIFVTVGTQLPFDRLIRMVEHVCSGLKDIEVHYQVGTGGYRPSLGTVTETMNREEFSGAIASADLIITHCGIGTIITCLFLGKPLICCPRRSDLGEHRNDHQYATACEIQEIVKVVQGEEELGDSIEFFRKGRESRSAPKSTVNMELIMAIHQMISDIVKNRTNS